MHALIVIGLVTISAWNIGTSDGKRLKLPQYYGWFVRSVDSRNVTEAAFRFYTTVFHNGTVSREFKNAIETTRQMRVTTLENYLNRRYAKGDRTLHLTAMYCDKGRVRNCSTYARQSVVKAALGRSTYLRVIGLFITPYTMGARIELDRPQRALWNSSDWQGKTGRACCNKINRFARYNVTNPGSVFRPTVGRGSRAHLTIATATSVTPVTTGLNLVDMIDCEGKCGRSGSYMRVSGRGINGKMRYYDYGRFMLYLDKPVLVRATFNAAYRPIVPLSTVLLVLGAVGIFNYY